MANYRLRIGFGNSYSLTAEFGNYILTGQPATLTKSTPSGSSFSWISTGADSYDVGWDTISHAGGDVNDPTLYPNRISVGTATSWINTTGQTIYAAVRSVLSGEVGPWSTEKGPLS